MGERVEDALLENRFRKRDHIENKLLPLINTGACCRDGQVEKVMETDYPPSEEVKIINSFRLDCHNCLKPNCSSRDPNCPVEEVQKRAEQFEKAEIQPK